ncbi:MAG TPA: alpha/beta fold hydrolase [Dehalococcoidia bacterium]|jgi:pimeloyl-ACP methyl ester carboxylesterase
MEPRIQYARTSDGVNIAYSVMGTGQSLVYPSNIWGDIHWYLHDEATRSGVDRLVASGWRVIRYDGRGMGFSDRDVTDFSLDARLLDLETVVSSAGLDRFVLCGYGQGGPLAISYAASYPDRVSHLALVNSFAQGSALYEKVPAMRALIGLRSMVEDQWEFFTLTLATAAVGFTDSARAKETAELFRSSTSAKTFLAFVDSAQKINLLHLLPKVCVPTLVALYTSGGFVTEDLSRDLAARIPGACLVTTDDYHQELHGFVRGGPLASVWSACAFDQGAEAPEVQLPSGRAAGLSAREVEVLRLLADGRSSREIGAELTLTVRTVERHITNIYRKIDVHNRAQATAFALERGLTRRSIA